LIRFFYPHLVGRKRDKDLFASNYFGSAADWRPPKHRTLKGELRKIDQLLAHLTIERQEYFEKHQHVWDLDEIEAFVLAVWNQFVADASSPWNTRFKPVEVGSERNNLALPASRGQDARPNRVQPM
jgi:hypothetical protein